MTLPKFRLPVNELPRIKNPRYPSESSSLLLHFIRGLKVHGFREVGNKKTAVILVIVVLVTESIWAYTVLIKNQVLFSRPDQKVIISSSPRLARAKVSLVTPKNLLKVGEQVEVAINLSSSRPSDGADLLIFFDPKFLSVVPTSGNQPVRVGSLYSNYPFNSLDAAKGQIAVSGINTTTGDVIPNGNFGTITFLAKSAGPTKIGFDFVKDSTAHSNIIESKKFKNILDEVSDLKLNIVP